jgi:hypothetical protein
MDGSVLKIRRGSLLVGGQLRLPVPRFRFVLNNSGHGVAVHVHFLKIVFAVEL